MEQLPDAPYIREAERFGMPPYDDDPEPTCPICGNECEIIYKDKDGTEFGCEHCIRTTDAREWAEEHKEEPDYDS